MQYSAQYKPALAWFAALAAAWVFVLVTLGALTTSLGAGMVFTDWPLSNGSLNPPGWLADIAMFSEHSHRLSGATMGILTLALALWLWRAETRAWLRRLGWFALALVIMQGVIGGQRVQLDAVRVPGFEMTLGQMLRIPHGVIAQVFVCVLFAIAASLARPRKTPMPASTTLLNLARVPVALLFVQLVVAALMRHNHAGLAIPTFPLAPEGGLIPAHWDFRVALAFAHRVLALAIAVAIAALAFSLWRIKRKNTAALLGALVIAQVTLGAFSVWSLRNPLITTAHVVCGASLLAAAFAVAWRMHLDSVKNSALRRIRARFADYLELTKPRLSMLSVLTAAAGFFAAPAFEIGAVFFWMLAGSALCAGGVAALNQWMESGTDALMRRTAARPIPAGRVAPGSAFVLGWLLTLAGLGALFTGVNGLAALFALATVVSYLALYTPAKRRSRFATEIGAVAGALPPLIGWAANESRAPHMAWILFGMLFLWQIPHFMAIAWIHRRDYETVSFPMLAVRDVSGKRTAVYSLVCTLALVALSASPFLSGGGSAIFLCCTLAAGLWFVARAIRFSRATFGAGNSGHAARRLFLASVVWLPLQLAVLVFSRA